jgi:Peptidase family M28
MMFFTTTLRYSILGFATVVFLSCNTASQVPTGKTATTTPIFDIVASVNYLASEELEGRGTGTEGERKASAYLVTQFKKMGLQGKGTEDYFQPYSYVPKNPAQIHQVGDSTKLGMGLAKEVKTRNVVAYLDNGSATTIIIGAHYDHLGFGDENSLWTGEKAIHNGADDNASGVACMLHLAQWLSAKPANTTNNNYLFIAFSGEEKGLFGSNHFTKNPTIDLKQVNYMLNMDMVGRMKDNKLAINGTGTATEWSKLFEALPKTFDFVFSESGVGPSDHTSFYYMDIPVLHFFTGQHEDYHKPSDDADKVNFDGIAAIGHYLGQLIQATNSKGKLSFQKTKDATPTASDFKVTLGVMPDYMYNGVGLKLDGTKEGRPGQKAGMLKGDILLKLGDIEIADIYIYMEALGKFEKGDRTKAVIDRNGEKINLEVVFE